MKISRLISCIVLVATAATGAQSTANLVDQLAQEASQRSTDYVSGADLARDQQTYIDQYWNNGFWRSFWSTSTANSTSWQQQMRVLKIHTTNCIAHLDGSVAWFNSCNDLRGADGQLVRMISYQSGMAGARTYTMSAIINGVTLTETGSYEPAIWNALKLDLYTAWVNQTSTDPNGKFLAQDYEIINLSLPNASTYQIAAGGGGQPDSSLLSLLIDNNTASNYSSTLPTDIDSADVSLNLTNATFDEAYAAMLQAGAIIAPSAIRQPSDAVASIRTMYRKPATNPATLRSRQLQLLFNELTMGGFSGGVFVFRALNHTRAYNTGMNNYTDCCHTLKAYYLIILDKLNTQLAEANQNDQTMLSMVTTYRDQRNQQDPISTVVTKGQAQQIFNSQVGGGSPSIPFISIAAYALWLVGPPWSETPCFPSPWVCTPNPLYYTIIAQLIRGLDKDGGIVLQPQNAAMASLKSAEQEEIAVSDIQDLVTKQAHLALLQAEQTNSYGNASFRINAQRTGSSAGTLPTLTTTNDPLVMSVMQGVTASRQTSLDLATQQQQYYNKMTGTGTMIERAALRNEQAVTKAQAEEELNRAINNRNAYRAMQRNEARQKEADKLSTDDALNTAGPQ
jgi:hypothetical protein